MLTVGRWKKMAERDLGDEPSTPTIGDAVAAGAAMAIYEGRKLATSFSL